MTEIYHRNWVTQFCRQIVPLPIVCKLDNQKSQEHKFGLILKSQGNQCVSPGIQRPKNQNLLSLIQKTDALTEEEGKYAFPSHCSVLTTVDWMMTTHVNEGGFSLLGLLIQMLMSAGNTVIGTCVLDHSRWHIKLIIMVHTWYYTYCIY